MIKLLARLARMRRDESGTATIEFVIVAPVFLMVLFMGVESGMLMARQAMFERAVDLTVRSLRLGEWPTPSLAELRSDICSNTVMIANCQSVVLLELQRVNTDDWNFPATPPACVDRDEEVAPVTTITGGGSNDMMLIRACVIVEPLFPTSNWGLRLPLDASGGFQMFSLASFVNEPR